MLISLHLLSMFSFRSRVLVCCFLFDRCLYDRRNWFCFALFSFDCVAVCLVQRKMSTISFASKQVHFYLVFMHQNLKQTDVHCLTYLLCDMIFSSSFAGHRLFSMASYLCSVSSYYIPLFVFWLSLHLKLDVWSSLLLFQCDCTAIAFYFFVCVFRPTIFMLRSYEWKDFSLYHFF